MGSDEFYPKERPVHRVSVDGFWMDEHPVTVADFRRFVKATGYVTVAERPLHPADFPGADPAALVPGALVFQRTRGPVDLRDVHNWWAYVPGASWRQPEGPGSSIVGRDRHPVTQVAFEDAEAYSAWVGKSIATEAEWEFAARGGLDGARFVWGDVSSPRRAACWPRGRASSRGRTRSRTASRERRRCARSRPMAMACTTWPATYGACSLLRADARMPISPRAETSAGRPWAYLDYADIVLTVTIDPTLQNAAILGIIVLLRTFLSFSLEIE